MQSNQQSSPFWEDATPPNFYTQKSGSYKIDRTAQKIDHHRLTGGNQGDYLGQIIITLQIALCYLWANEGKNTKCC